MSRKPSLKAENLGRSDSCQTGYWLVRQRYFRGARSERSMGAYTDEHARKGLDAPLPPIECWANQFPNYRITIRIPEFTSVCPLTEQPDFGTVTITYVPRDRCLELKSLKLYIHAYRQLGIFYENAINRILRDVVAACDPVECTVTGDFRPRGGISSFIEATYRATDAAQAAVAPKGGSAL